VRIVLITVLVLFLLVNLVGAFLEPSVVVERELVVQELDLDDEEDAARLFALTGDFAAWEAWAPLMQVGGGEGAEVRPGESTAGVGGSTTLVFDAQYAVLLMFSECDPKDGVVVEARMGSVSDDLASGEDDFRAWDRIGWERAAGGGTRLTWTRTGAKLPLYLLRVWDHFVVAPSVAGQLEEGLERLAEAAASDDASSESDASGD